MMIKVAATDALSADYIRAGKSLRGLVPTMS